jgi:hypothetical protein
MLKKRFLECKSLLLRFFKIQMFQLYYHLTSTENLTSPAKRDPADKLVHSGSRGFKA